MSPPPATAQVRAAPARRVTSAPRPVRPPLRVVEPGGRRARRVRRRPLAGFVAVGLLVVCLLAVVVGHTFLASEQVQLSTVQSQLAAQQVIDRQATLAVTWLEAPPRIAQAAQRKLGMVPPGQIQQLAAVPLSVPLATPKVTPGPATTP